MSRPALTSALPAADFHDFYWLKAELVAFCREHGLPTTGPKAAVADRVAAFLDGRPVLRPEPTGRGTADPLPDVLALGTRIGRGWTCGQRLRAFFEGEVGPTFRFNQALVAFVRGGEGRTLGEALEAWSAARAAGPGELAAQFEYNRHARSYRAAHPGATGAEVRAAWWEKRAARRSEWKDDAETGYSVAGSPHGRGRT